MKLLLFSGLLYLAGVSAILYIKPLFMFREDGTWKEFGIGRSPVDYTWMPFWLAAILWAIVCYLLVMILSDTFGRHTLRTVQIDQKYPNQPRGRAQLNTKRASNIVNMEDGEPMPGYYMLDARAAGKRGGVPRYIYVGEAPPNEFDVDGGADMD